MLAVVRGHGGWHTALSAATGTGTELGAARESGWRRLHAVSLVCATGAACMPRSGRVWCAGCSWALAWCCTVVLHCSSGTLRLMDPFPLPHGPSFALLRFCSAKVSTQQNPHRLRGWRPSDEPPGALGPDVGRGREGDGERADGEGRTVDGGPSTADGGGQGNGRREAPKAVECRPWAVWVVGDERAALSGSVRGASQRPIRQIFLLLSLSGLSHTRARTTTAGIQGQQQQPPPPPPPPVLLPAILCATPKNGH